MKVPVWLKSGTWGAVVGAIAIMIFGFWEMGWTTADAANRMAAERADSAVVAALLTFCIANAERDPDQEKLVKLGAEQSPYDRSQIVLDAGWANMPGMTTPDRGLAYACSDRLQGSKA
jgi:hypothetical protein